MNVDPLASQRTPRILVVDDQRDHVILIRKALERQEPPPTVQVAYSGEEALKMIREDPPDLVLLDLNMPGMSGHEVLEAIRADIVTRRLAVSILSTSNRQQDVDSCFDLHVNAYVQKPAGFKALVDTMKVVTEHWFNATLLPSNPK